MYANIWSGFAQVWVWVQRRVKFHRGFQFTRFMGLSLMWTMFSRPSVSKVPTMQRWFTQTRHRDFFFITRHMWIGCIVGQVCKCHSKAWASIAPPFFRRLLKTPARPGMFDFARRALEFYFIALHFWSLHSFIHYSSGSSPHAILPRILFAERGS